MFLLKMNVFDIGNFVDLSKRFNMLNAHFLHECEEYISPANEYEYPLE